MFNSHTCPAYLRAAGWAIGHISSIPGSPAPVVDANLWMWWGRCSLEGDLGDLPYSGVPKALQRLCTSPLVAIKDIQDA